MRLHPTTSFVHLSKIDRSEHLSNIYRRELFGFNLFTILQNKVQGFSAMNIHPKSIEIYRRVNDLEIYRTSTEANVYRISIGNLSKVNRSYIGNLSENCRNQSEIYRTSREHPVRVAPAGCPCVSRLTKAANIPTISLNSWPNFSPCALFFTHISFLENLLPVHGRHHIFEDQPNFEYTVP